MRNKLGKEISEIVPYKQLDYSGKKIIIYIDDFKSKDKKYLEFKNNIKLYDFRDNEHGGFYLKEFINQETFYNILLNSNSSFAQKFKKEIAKILDKLTMNGNIIIENDKIQLKENYSNKLENMLDSYENEVCLYKNHNLISFIKDRMSVLKNENWNKYMNKHIMYCFIITIEDPEEKNRILCKSR